MRQQAVQNQLFLRLLAFKGPIHPSERGNKERAKVTKIKENFRFRFCSTWVGLNYPTWCETNMHKKSKKREEKKNILLVS